MTAMFNFDLSFVSKRRLWRMIDGRKQRGKLEKKVCSGLSTRGAKNCFCCNNWRRGLASEKGRAPPLPSYRSTIEKRTDCGHQTLQNYPFQNFKSERKHAPKLKWNSIKCCKTRHHYSGSVSGFK